MSADQITADLSKASIDEKKVSPNSEAPSSPASPAPSNYFEGSAQSSFSTPDNSRPPSPLLKPLASTAGISSRGLPSKPHGFNAISGASMGFSAIANKKATPAKPTDEDESDDEDSVDGAEGTDMPRAPPVRRTSSAAMAPFITKFDLYEPTVSTDLTSGTQTPGKLEKVAIVGSGSWGTALARVAAINAAQREGFDPEVRMWVREREVRYLKSSHLP